MAFYVNVKRKINKLMTLPMNKFTNVIIPTYFQFMQMPSIETKIWCIIT